MLATGLLASGLLSTPARAEFPDHTITLATGFGPGGSTDVAARLVADRMQQHLGQGARIVVENRPGAAGVIASEWLKRQAPDGYTIMLVDASSHAVAPAATRGGTRYDPVEDFAPVGMIGTSPMLLVGSTKLATPTADELIALLRSAPPDSIAYASSGVGSIPHMAAEMLRVALGLPSFPHVPYRSGGQMMESIAKHETGWGMAVLASGLPMVRDGMVRGLAVTGSTRFPSLPEIPTLTEGAVPGFEVSTYNAIIAPKGLPPAVQQKLNRALLAALAEPALRDRLLTAGVQTWDQENSPDATRAFIAAQYEKFRAAAKATGVELD